MSVTVAMQVTDEPEEEVTTKDGAHESEVIVVLGVPITTFAPVSADTGMLPHMVSPETVVPEATAQDAPVQYSRVDGAEDEEVMQTFAVPPVIPTTLTS